MFHFSIDDSANSLYLSISSIRPSAKGLQLSGTVGDGSAEAAFEASLGVRMQVRLIPVWAPGEETLCQRYDQGLLELAVQEALGGISIHSESDFDPASGSWRQCYEAKPRLVAAYPSVQPHQARSGSRVHEQGPDWQIAAV